MKVMTRDMNKTVMRILSIALLMMVSIGAGAEVKVIYGEKGTELQADKDGTITIGQKEGLTGGTIVITQVAQRDGTTKVTLAVTPDKGYRLAENGLEVYTVAPADISQTRTVTASTKLDIKSEDFKDEASKRTYTATIDSNLALWLKSATFALNESKGNRDAVTYTYYALHANGKGYMKQRHAAVANDGTFRYENVYDGNGYSIWVYSSEGYLTNDMYYLCEANGTLILSDKPSTKWDLVTDGDKTRLQKQGTTKIVGLNSGGTPVLDEPENLSNKYAVCEMTIEENNNKWEGPKDVSYTVRSPQLVTFMRVYYIHNITATILKNDAGKINQKVVDKKDSRIFQRLKFKSTTDTNRGTSWDIDETNAVIYNKQASGDVSVTATYTLTSCDPIAAGNHPAVDANVTLKIQPAVLTPDPDKNYLLFYIKDANYRFPYDKNEMSVDDPVAPNATKSVLSDPVPTDGLNKQIAWVIEADNEGFVSFKNAETGRYLYYDATDYTHQTNYGVVKVGVTTLPANDNRYKFRLYQPANHNTYGVCQTIIPYDLQFVVGRSEGDNGIINDGICCAWNVYTTPKVISLWKGNGDSKWKIYAYEAENRLKSDWTLNGPNDASGIGTYNFTATTYYSRNIVGSPVNNRDLEIAKTYTKLPVKYKWTVSGINSYVTTTDNSTNGDGKLAVSVNSMPVSNTLGTVKCEAFVDVGSYTITVDEVEREFTVEKKLSNNKSVAFNLYPLSTTPSSFTEISSLSEIADASGNYRLTADCSDNVPADITDFKGWLDGDNHTISGLSAPLFAKMSGSSVVRNLNLQNVSISANGKVGTICAEATENARIYNVGILSGSVGSSDDYCGGLVGLLDGAARVINCFSYANITGGTYVGGIVGYNNYASTSANLMTMVMNCMFYGDITATGDKAPVYNGKSINNFSTNDTNRGLNNYNYFRFNRPYVGSIDHYNCALGAEDRYLDRFEFFRHTLNSNRELAAWYITGNADDGKGDDNIMAKWVLEPSQIGTDTPYPILKPQNTYPSVVNHDAANAVDIGDEKVNHNKGRKFGTLTVNISLGTGYPTGAALREGKSSLTLNITDKDTEHYDFNYRKVQLPYYNEVGTGNYTHNKVVTGWKMTVSGGTTDFVNTGTDAPAFNFVDRKSTGKDNFETSGRVFSQGAYYEVPDGVTSISIEPYWANCVYLADAALDVTYSTGYAEKQSTTAHYTNGSSYPINGDNQVVYTDFDKARTALAPSSSNNVYDKAIVLVGNYHRDFGSSAPGGDNVYPMTIMSVDLNFDNEPDYCLFYAHSGRRNTTPIRFDFITMPAIALALKPYGSSAYRQAGIFKPKGWFEITNTALIRLSQFEYGQKNIKTISAPLILMGGVIEQIVSTEKTGSSEAGNTPYIHVGGNVWFNEFNNGCHTNSKQKTPKTPISVSGGDYNKFYLSGIYTPDAPYDKEHAECYIDGGRFAEVAGAGMQQIDGDVTWFINGADIKAFYGGGINPTKAITGNINTTITNSWVTNFYGGPKFGDMATGKTVTTKATGCYFGNYFGAGFGGNAYNRFGHIDTNISDESSWNTWRSGNYKRTYNSTYGGIGTSYEYEYIINSDGSNRVGRFYVNYASLSLASTKNVTSTLTDCTISKNFYGGGSLGSVNGNVISTLTNCTVEGSAFGAGFSATTPTIDVMNNENFVVAPHYDSNAGVFNDDQVKYPATVKYTWTNDASKFTLTGSSLQYFYDSGDTHLIYTSTPLSDLGRVTGTVKLNIEGNTLIKGYELDDEGEITTKQQGGVFGGGDASGVTGSTEVTANASGQKTEGYNVHNVYGGGNSAPVSGNTVVTIKGNTVVNDNVYGGGNEGPVTGSTTVNIEQ